MSDYHFATAYIKGVKSQPRKTNIVASLVRNRTVDDAVVILENTPRRAALPVKKAVQSACANLLNSGSPVDARSIYINRISVTSGARMRRYKPASRGRALPYEIISSNIFVEVCGKEKVRAKKSEDIKSDDKKSAAKKTTTKKTATEKSNKKEDK